MLIYIINILSIPFWYYLSYVLLKSTRYTINRLPNDRIRRRRNRAASLTINIVTIQMLLIAGLRGLSVGTDTSSYYRIFQEISTLSFNRIPTYYMEFGYSLINKVVSLWFGDYQVLLFLLALISMLGVNRFISKTSSNKIMSLYLFITIGYYSTMMNAMRQYLALALILMSYFAFIWEQNRKKACVLIVVASTIHSTAIVIILVYIVYLILYSEKLKESWIIKLLAICGGAVIMLLLPRIMQYLSLLGIKDYDLLFGGNVTVNIISFNMLIKIALSILYFRIPKRLIVDKLELRSLQFLNYINIVSCFVNIASSFYPLLARFNVYFAFTIIIFIPNLFKYIKINKNYLNKIIYVGFFCLWIYDMWESSIVPWVIYSGM